MTSVPQRLEQEVTTEVVALMPLVTVSVTVSATFWMGAPTAVKRSVNTPLFSFAMVEGVYIDVSGIVVYKKYVRILPVLPST